MPKRRSEKRSAPRPGSALPATKETLAPQPHPSNTGYETTTRRRRRTVAGDVGPGFHTWPSGHIPQTPVTNALIRIRPSAPAKKDVRRGARHRERIWFFLTDRKRLRGQRPQLQKKPWPLSHILQTLDAKPPHSGAAATVAGGADPGFHTWPTGHIPQDNSSETSSPHPAPCQKDVRRGVRRRDRGQRPTATKDTKTKRLRRYVNFPTRANGTMTFPVSGHPPCVRYNFLTVCPIPDPHHVSGTIASPCVRHRTTTLFPVTPTRTRLNRNHST